MFSLTWKTLWYRPTRTVIALIQALVGTTVVILALAAAFAQDQVAISSDLTQLTAGTRTKNSISTYNVFTLADLSKLKKLAPDVLGLDVVGDQYISGLEVGQARYKVSNGRATGPDYAAITGLKVLYGSYFNRKDVDGEAKVLALSANAARTLFGKEDAVGETLKVIAGGPNGGPIPYRVVAITDNASPRDQGVAIPILMPVTIDRYDTGSSSLLVRAQIGRMEQAKAQLLLAVKQTYKNEREFQMALSKGQDGFFYSAIGNAFSTSENTSNPALRATYAIAALTLIVSSLGVLATLLVGVNERTRELGMRRAIGATRIQIICGLLLETGLTTLLGSLLGVALAFTLASLLNSLFVTTFQTAPLIVNLPLAGAVLGLFVGLSVLFGLLPALLSTRLRPTVALRTQG